MNNMRLVDAALIAKRMIRLDQWNCDIIKKLANAVEWRLVWMELREPKGFGSVYDEWEEKLTELEEIHESLNYVVASLGAGDDSKELVEVANKAGNDILVFQREYGGLSRLKL